MAIPQNVSIVTLGVRDLSSLRAFYRGWGWSETEGASEAWAAFDVGGWLLSLYPLDLLGREAAPGEPVPQQRWNGFTLAINVDSESELRAMYDAAVAAGASVVSPPVRREWGGISGYVSDPEGNRWELAIGSDVAE